MSRYPLVFVLLSLSLVCGSQTTISVSKFLKGADKNENVVFHKSKIAVLEKISNDIPIVEKIEFRTETNDFDFRKQEYLLRISPNNSQKIKTQKQYHQSIEYLSAMEMSEAYRVSIFDRYNLMVDYIFLNENLEAYKNFEILLNDKVTLFKRSISLANFNVLDLIEAEDDAQENSYQILDLENALLTLERIIQRMNKSNDGIQLNREALISINDVKQILSDVQAKELPRHPILEVLSSKKYNKMLEYERELAKSKFSIGYIQAKYGYEPSDNFKKNFSIGVGFDIPLKNPSRFELNEIQIEILATESKYRNVKSELHERRFSLFHELQNLIKKYGMLASDLENSQAEFALKEYSKIAEASPKAILKLRENTLSKEILLSKLNYEIMKKYVVYLDLSGILMQEPFKNYLYK